MKEEVVLFGKTKALVGIITDPPEAKTRKNFPAVILLNAGVLHRVGPNRFYVKMARKLAAMGFVVLRFDFSGIGDSKIRADNLPLNKSVVSETQEAINWLNAARGIERFILGGICSGARISFQIACYDLRVVGAVLVNAPSYQHGASEALRSYIIKRKDTRYYWKIALINPKSWLKAIQGKVDYHAIVRSIAFQLKSLFDRKKKVWSERNKVVADFRLLTERGVRLLLVYSEGDPGLDFFQMILGDEIHDLNSNGKLNVEIMERVDHTVTPLSRQEHLLELVGNWAYETAQG